MAAARFTGQHFEGECKFWNAIKGYGFLIDSKGGSDLFVGQADLVTGDDRFRGLTPGFKVECTVEVKDGKTSGKSVKSLGGGNLPSFKDKFTCKRAIEEAKPADPNKKSGKVKWFNEQKRFGFIVSDETGSDLFFHGTECLRNVVPQPDDVVHFQYGTDSKGKVCAVKIQNKTRRGAQTGHTGMPVSMPAPGQAYMGGMGGMGAMGAMGGMAAMPAMPAMPSMGSAMGGAGMGGAGMGVSVGAKRKLVQLPSASDLAQYGYKLVRVGAPSAEAQAPAHYMPSATPQFAAAASGGLLPRSSAPATASAQSHFETVPQFAQQSLESFAVPQGAQGDYNPYPPEANVQYGQSTYPPPPEGYTYAFA